jgi:hypothetical protein
MNDTFGARLAGILLLLSMVVEFAAIGIAFSHGMGRRP